MSRRIKVIEQLALSDLNDKSGWADLGIAEGTKYVADETFRSEVPSRNIDSDCDVSQLGMVRPLHKLVNYMIHDPVIEFKNQVAPFGDRNEQVRWDPGSIGSFPSNERFKR